MTASVSAHAVRPVPGPCLTTGPWAGLIIGAFFAAGVLLFLLGLITLAS